MSTPTVTNTFTNGTTSDAGQVNQNFSDILDALTDGTKDLTIGTLIANAVGTAALRSTIGNNLLILNSDGSGKLIEPLQSSTGIPGISLNSDGSVNLLIGSQFLTSGGTATTLDYYEEGSFSVTFNQGAGVGSTGNTFTINFIRIGKQVTLMVPAFTFTAGATNNNIGTDTTGLPARLIPSSDVAAPTFITNGGTNDTPGGLRAASDGSLIIFRSAAGDATFGSGNTIGTIYQSVLTYTIQ